MSAFAMRFLRDEQGATAIEYGIMAAMIAVAIIGVVTQLGLEVRAPFETATAGLQARSP